MGIDTATYRARIGTFHLCCRAHPQKQRSMPYNPYSSGPDVHYRSFACGIMFVCVFLALYGVTEGHSHILEQYAQTKINQCGLSTFPSAITSILTCDFGGKRYIPYIGHLLVQSGDVELNPGPTNDTEMILNAIKETKSELFGELNLVKNEVIGVKTEMKVLQADLKCVTERVDRMYSRQTNIEANLECVMKRVSTLEKEKDFLVNDFREIALHHDYDNNRLENIEQQLDYIESEKLKCSLRIFGLPENESDSKSLKSLVDESVLQVMGEGDKVSASDLMSAKRVVNRIKGKPRTVIAKFVNFNDKMKLFKYRDKLRSKQIRISNDLTYRQRGLIREANENGFRGYFKQGQFYRVPRQDQARTTQRGVRTLDDRNREYLRNTGTAHEQSNVYVGDAAFGNTEGAVHNGSD